MKSIAQEEWENPHYLLNLVVTRKANGMEALGLLESLVDAHMERLTGPAPEFKLLAGVTPHQLTLAQRAMTYVIQLKRELIQVPGQGIDSTPAVVLPPVATALEQAQHAWLLQFREGDAIPTQQVRDVINSEHMSILRATGNVYPAAFGGAWIYTSQPTMGATILNQVSHSLTAGDVRTYDELRELASDPDLQLLMAAGYLVRAEGGQHAYRFMPPVATR